VIPLFSSSATIPGERLVRRWRRILELGLIFLMADQIEVAAGATALPFDTSQMAERVEEDRLAEKQQRTLVGDDGLDVARSEVAAKICS
jgi:hypothetical protein